MIQNTLLLSRTYDKAYAAITNSKFSVEGNLTNPKTLTVKHNTNQGITSTAIEFVNDEPVVIGSISTNSRLKVLVKLQYQGNRTDTSAELLAMLADAKQFIDAEISSLLNKEV